MLRLIDCRRATRLRLQFLRKTQRGSSWSTDLVSSSLTSRVACRVYGFGYRYGGVRVLLRRKYEAR